MATSSRLTPARVAMLGTAAAAILLAIYLLPARVDARAHAVDDWLSQHPTIANALIWEFPPPPTRPDFTFPIKTPVWARFEITPYPSLYPALSFSAFSERVIGDVVVRRDASLSSLVAGMDPGRIVSTSPERGNSTRANGLKPGLVLDFIPAGVKKSEYGAEIRSWSQWPESAKQQLRDRYDDYTAWASNACPLYAAYAASEFTVKPAGFDDAFTSLVDLDPSPVIDPPVNLQPDDPLVPGTPWAMVGSSPAFALYVRLVAAQLAMELGGCLPWSLGDYTSGDLPPLFDGRSVFRYVPAGPSSWGTMTATGHIVVSSVTPAPPLVTLGFLGQHGLIGTNRTDTVTRLFEWERHNLRHVVGGTTAVPLGAGELYFDYNGSAPVSRMINGTVMAAPVILAGNSTYFDGDVLHWVGGCGGASGFTAEVLKLLNIAVERTVFGHFQNRIAVGSGDHIGTAHADDPYGMKSGPEIPTAGILLDDATFQAWFVDESDQAKILKNVSRRGADLWLQYLPELLLQLHCSDLAANRNHANSLVYGWSFAATYSVAEMEIKGLWTGIQAKLDTLGGCAAFGYPGF